MFSDGLVAFALACGLLGAAGSVCGQSVSYPEGSQAPSLSIRAQTHAGVDRSEIGSMPDLVESLLDAIARLSTYHKPTETPRVTRVSRAEIERMLCNRPCMVKAFYLPNEGVFFDEALTPETDLIHRSILFHELVHFVQEASGEAANLDACHRWVQREEQAYELQARYLAQIGDESGFMQKVSAQSALVGSRTVCRGWSPSAEPAQPPRQIFSGAGAALRQ